MLAARLCRDLAGSMSDPGLGGLGKTQRLTQAVRYVEIIGFMLATSWFDIECLENQVNDDPSSATRSSMASCRHVH